MIGKLTEYQTITNQWNITNNHLILRRAKVAEKAKLKITLIYNFSENFEKPPKLKRLVN